MDKPTTVRRQEFIDSLVELINNSGLPAFVISPIIEDTLQKVLALEHQQYEQDLEAWEWEQKKQQENNDADL